MSVDKPLPIEYLIGGPDYASSRGHAQMAARRDALPAEGTGAGKDDRKILEHAGVVFGEIDPQNELFRQATLPEGWTIRRTEHHLWSELADAEGRRRARIFYSAQDGTAWISCARSIQADVVQDEAEGPYIPAIVDSDGRQLWRGKAVAHGEVLEREARRKEAHEAAARKADEVAPDWRSFDAYWGAAMKALAFPPHETPPDTRDTYVLTTELWSGHFRDYRDGGEHARRKAKDDAEAVAALRATMGHLAGYDVKFWIKCGERLVDHGMVPARANDDDRRRGPWIMGPRGRMMRGRTFDGHTVFEEEP